MTLPCRTSEVQQNLPFPTEQNHYLSNRPGWFGILESPRLNARQKMFRTEEMNEVLRWINTEIDIYISQNVFFRPSRCLVNLANIGLNYLDLDYYHNDSLRYLSAEQVAGQVLMFANDNGIPAPSIIVSSGHGLYLKWFLAKPIPRQALPRWNALQTILVSRFEQFAADPRAKDASRVLRLESTINSKTGRRVEVVYPPKNSAPELYDFEVLCREVLPVEREIIREHKQQLMLIKGQGRETKGLKKTTPLQLNWDRLEDLRKLVQLRGGVHDGMRDECIFLATCFTAGIVTNVRREVDALIKEFAGSMAAHTARSYLSSAIKRAEAAHRGEKIQFGGQMVDPRYRFRNQTLIERLHITPDEERQLQTIISRGEKNYRHAERERTRRAAQGAVDRNTYLQTHHQAAEDRAASAKLMKAKGESIRQIAAAMGISKSAVQRYLA